MKSVIGKDSNVCYSNLLRAALKANVCPCFLSVAGVMDESNTVGKILYLFNVEDPEHKKYRSTVADMVKL